MKLGTKLLLACAAMVATTPAHAAFVTGQISIGGGAQPIGPTNQWSTATGVNTNGNITSYDFGTGSFAGLTCLAVNCGTISDIPSLGSFVAIPNFLTLNVSNIKFDLNSVSNINNTSDGTGGTLSFTGLGTIYYDGFDATPGQFTFTAQGQNITSFSASAISAAVPEPGTWALMLLGFGAIGYSLRRRRFGQSVLPQAA